MRRQHPPALEVQNIGPTHIKAAAPPIPTSPRAPAPAATAGKRLEAATPDTASRANPPATTGKLTRGRE